MRANAFPMLLSILLAYAICRPELAAELDVLEQELGRDAKARPQGDARVSPHPGALPEAPTRGSSAAAERELFARAVDLRRRIIFSHPALDFDRLLLSKRPPPVLSAPGDNYYGMHNGTGPGLVILDQSETDRPKETVLLAGKLPRGCAMHADVSFDGRRIVFAYADHTPPRDQWQFFLYEIHADGTGLRQITGRDDDPFYRSRSRETADARTQNANSGEFGCVGTDGGRMTVLCEDYDPCYLPDGGIAFISTRNQGGVRCHNRGRYCPTYLLYRCDADGSNVRQLSFGEANEWDPAVLTGDGRLVKITQYGGETWYSRPKDYFAHGGTLAPLLLKAHEGVDLGRDPQGRQRIIDWLDLNAPLYGTYSWNKDEWRRPNPEGEQALRAHIRQRLGEELAGQPFAALVNVALPEESRILKAPLALAAGGWGQIERGGWKSTDDPEYRKMRELVQAAIQPLPSDSSWSPLRAGTQQSVDLLAG